MLRNKISISISLIMVVSLTFSSAEAGSMAEKGKDVKMSPKELKPFGLDSDALKSAKIFMAVYTPKTGMGKEQIEILGDGTVKLIRSDNDRAPDQIILGNIEPQKVAALLELFESEGFMGFEESYSTDSPILNTHEISLTLPSGKKQVNAEVGSAPSQFNQLMGAIRLLAAMGAPQALGKRYFSHL